MNVQHFTSQKAATNYYRHSWEWILKHYYVQTTFNSLGNKTGYRIKKP